ncbi:MAG: DUF5615 family PIN-like protein [Beijerinckiaceae bacterium]
MNWRFLVDEQCPPTLARYLAALGYEALHVKDAGLRAAADGAIWRYAARHNWVIVTKDRDFVELGWNVDACVRVRQKWPDKCRPFWKLSMVVLCFTRSFEAIKSSRACRRRAAC